MKHFIIALAALTCVAANAQIGVDAIAKQRAKDVANQNNNRNVDPYGSPAPAASASTPATAPAVTATPMTPAQQAFGRFQLELFSVKTNSSPEAKQQFSKDLSAVSQGANKPSAATAGKLSDHLTTAMAEAKLTQTKKTRVAQEVGMLLNSAKTPVDQKQAMIKDVQTTLQTGGASSENAAAVEADLQTITQEVAAK